MVRTHSHAQGWTRRLVVLAAVTALGVVLVGAGTVRANTVKKTDLVFVIDATGSMGDEIGAVRNGLSDFIDGLDTSLIDARFAVALYGGPTELVLDWTTSKTVLTNAFDTISVNGAVSGFQNNHNQNPEAGLEALRIILDGATNNTLQRNNVGGSGPLSFRSDARKNFILVTDEDADGPYYSDNRFGSQGSGDPPSPLTSDWQDEVDATAVAAISEQIFLNMIINPSDAPSVLQYGDPNKDVSDADFLNWNAALTLQGLQNAGNGDCLQAQLLSAGLVARAFNITNVADAGFVDNFFAAKLEEIQDDPGVVPEPTLVCTFGMGLVSLVGYLRRRRAGSR